MNKISNHSTILLFTRVEALESGASKQNKKGVVTLMAVLIIGFTITAIIFSSSLYSRLSIMNSKIIRENEQNKYFSEVCVEKALITIRNDRNYVGNGNFSEGNFNCEYLISNNGSGSRLIKASSTLNGMNYILEIDTTVGNNQLTIDYWKRITTF